MSLLSSGFWSRSVILRKFQFRKLSTSVIEEEYYEDVGSHNEIQTVMDTVATVPSVSTSGTSKLERIVEALLSQRVKDLIVVKNDDQSILSPYDYKIVCSTFNARQASAISENLRKLLKIEGDLGKNHPKSIIKRSNGWFVNEIDGIQIHLMNEEIREKYDLEMMWIGNEKLREMIENDHGYDDFPMIPEK